MNVQSTGFPSLMNEQPYQDYVSSKTMISTQSSVSWETLALNLHSRVFPSVTDKWPFQDHLPSKTIILTQRSVSQENDIFKTIFWRQKYHTDSKLFFPGKRPFQGHLSLKLLYWLPLSPRKFEQWISKGFSSVTNKWPFQDHLSGKTILSTWSSVSRSVFKTIFWLKLLDLPKAWSLRKLAFQDQLLSKSLT